MIRFETKKQTSVKKNQMTPNTPIRFAIVRAGISGLILANLLSKNEISITIYERFPDIKTFGTGMTLWPNATRILNNLEILDQILPTSKPLHKLKILHANGRQIMTIPTEQFEVVR